MSPAAEIKAAAERQWLRGGVSESGRPAAWRLAVATDGAGFELRRVGVPKLKRDGQKFPKVRT